MEIAGVILAGGKNSRMGFPKAFLKVDGKRIIDSILGALRPVFDEIIISANDKELFSEFKDIEVTEDIIRDCGPLGGIHAALKKTARQKAFFIACDMPFLRTGLIERLLEAAKDSDAECVIPCSDNDIEPLCAVYSKRILARLEGALRKGEFKVKEFLKGCDCRYLKCSNEELPAFFNINTPGELQEIACGRRNDIKDRQG